MARSFASFLTLRLTVNGCTPAVAAFAAAFPLVTALPAAALLLLDLLWPVAGDLVAGDLVADDAFDNGFTNRFWLAVFLMSVAGDFALTPSPAAAFSCDLAGGVGVACLFPPIPSEPATEDEAGTAFRVTGAGETVPEVRRPRAGLEADAALIGSEPAGGTAAAETRFN